MISINIYNRIGDTGEDEELQVFSHTEQKNVNEFVENLETYILINNVTPTGYQNIQIINDEVFNQTVRVRGQIVHQVVKQDMYQAYLKVRNKRENGIANLVTLCRKEHSVKVKDILERNFSYNYEQHAFDILKIIDAAADVRNARFNVRIETVNSVSMRGTRVHDTQYYEQMLRSGQLTGVIISYDMASQSVTFRINVDGSILLYSQLTDFEILDLIEDLLNI